MKKIIGLAVLGALAVASPAAMAFQHRFGTQWAAMITVSSNGTVANTTVAGAASYSW